MRAADQLIVGCRQLFRFWLPVLMLAPLLTGPARAADPPAVTDESVDAAIRRAITWIKTQRTNNNWEEHENRDDLFYGGSSALANLALLYAGEDPRTDFMTASLDWLAAQTLNGTYTYGVRAHALALVPGTKYQSRLQSDLEWLTGNVNPANSRAPGSYGYRGAEDRWDNSNSQYGVLGTWMATDAGLTATDAYWELVGSHWLRTQAADGGWGYQEGYPSTGSMTAAGLATLFVVLDRLYTNRPADAASVTAAISSGLNWLGREFTPENPFGDKQWLFYYLYGVERVGRASGYKYFRQRDWFREGAAFLLSEQQPEGHWRGTGEYMSDLRNTCFALMFFCHGRAPLLCNKLEHGPDWNRQLRDAAGLTHYAQHALERLLNWQIVRLDGSLDDLLEAPILLLTGREAWEFDDVEVQKIREYCLRGGLVLAVSGGESFLNSMRTLAERAFPDFRLRPLTSEHPLFSGEVQFPIERPPRMSQIHNGLRALMLICEEDLAASWHRGRGHREYFQLGCNLYNYATDKTNVRSRLQTTTIPVEQVEVTRKISIALIRYDGAWNVEPYGWTRLKAYLNNKTATRLLVTSGLALDAPELKDFKIAYITGLDAHEFTEAEREGLKAFLRGGGTLLADTTGGHGEFDKSLSACCAEILRVEPRRLPADSYVLTGEGIPDAVSITDVGYTRVARGTRGNAPPIYAFDVGRRLSVIYSPLDISAGLLGTHVYDRRGYDADSALSVMRNLLLYADLPTREKSKLSRE
ncbi:MAG: DUF4159 domain-containing protein [Phycisphaerae bacterium]|jgi:hypothetical protein